MYRQGCSHPCAAAASTHTLLSGHVGSDPLVPHCWGGFKKRNKPLEPAQRAAPRQSTRRKRALPLLVVCPCSAPPLPVGMSTLLQRMLITLQEPKQGERRAREGQKPCQRTAFHSKTSELQSAAFRLFHAFLVAPNNFR